MQVRARFRKALSEVLHQDGCPVSYAEMYGEALNALEDLSRMNAAKMKAMAEICREEYCKPAGGSYSAIEGALSDLQRMGQQWDKDEPT